MFGIVFTERAARQLKKLRFSGVQQRLFDKAVDSLAADPKRGIPLRKTLKGYYKLRVGDYRIVYDLDTSHSRVVIIAVGHRKNIYTTLERGF